MDYGDGEARDRPPSYLYREAPRPPPHYPTTSSPEQMSERSPSPSPSPSPPAVGAGSGAGAPVRDSAVEGNQDEDRPSKHVGRRIGGVFEPPRRPYRSRSRSRSVSRSRSPGRSRFQPTAREDSIDLEMRHYLQRSQDRSREPRIDPVVINDSTWKPAGDSCYSSDSYSPIDIHLGRSSRSRSRIRSPSLSSVEVGEYEDFIAHKVYEFTPSRSSSHAGSKSENGSDSEAPPMGSKELPPKNETPQVPRATQTFQIYQSQYTGDAFLDGSHSAKLTIVHDPKKERRPLFRWMYVS